MYPFESIIIHYHLNQLILKGSFDEPHILYVWIAFCKGLRTPKITLQINCVKKKAIWLTDFVILQFLYSCSWCVAVLFNENDITFLMSASSGETRVQKVIDKLNVKALERSLEEE